MRDRGKLSLSDDLLQHEDPSCQLSPAAGELCDYTRGLLAARLFLETVVYVAGTYKQVVKTYKDSFMNNVLQKDCFPL